LEPFIFLKITGNLCLKRNSLTYSQTIMQKMAAIQIYKDFSLSSDWN